MSAGPNFLMFSRDPGGSNQLIALHALLRQRRDGAGPVGHPALDALLDRLDGCGEPVVYGKDYARDWWRRAGIAVHDWDAEIGGAPAAMVRLFDQLSPTVVVTGTTDIDDDTDCRLWAMARTRGIEAWCLCDHFVNMEARFRLADNSVVHPDKVIAAHGETRRALLAAGVPADRLVDLPDLHLRRIKAIAGSVDGATIGHLRHHWGVADGGTALVFASENAREMAACGRPAAYDELAVIRTLVADLAQGRPPQDLPPLADKVVVVIRPHPRDPDGKYDCIAGAGSVSVMVSRDGTPLEVVMAADGVVGMDTTMLFEADTLGRPACSVVPASSFNRLRRSQP